MTLFGHIPISQTELGFQREYGGDALLDRMQEGELSWVFDAANRPPLVE